MTSIRALSVIVATGLFLAGCGGNGGEQAAAKHGGHGNGGGRGGNTPGQPPVPVAIDVVATGAIASYYAATATLAPENEAEILARVAGVVRTLDCEEGDRVKRGDVLLTIENDEYMFRLRQAEANRADFQARLDRLEKMASQDLVSVEELETLKNNLKTAEAEEGLARTNLSYTQVTAPFGGSIVARRVGVGQNLTAGMPLFQLSDFDPLLARIHVPARQFNLLEPDQPVDLVLESDGTRLEGWIKLINPTIDPGTGTIKVTIEIRQYPVGVRPGDFARVRIVTERREGSTLVPRIAVVTDRGEQVVYVSADSTAERRVVELGFQDDQHAEIISGVSPGEQVIVKGQRSLKHGSPIKILADDRVAESETPAREGS